MRPFDAPLPAARAADPDPRHYDCVGVGVGPANLSLASLLYPQQALRCVFIERQPQFGWHDGQQVAGGTLQVSMLKDLVTLSDPTNPFSFLAFLHEKGRIYHFINAQFDAVPRQEFRDYLEWAAENNPYVTFGETVRSIDFTNEFVIETDRRTLTATHVSIGVGNGAWVPSYVTPHLSEHHFHVSQYLSRERNLAGRRVAVVGGGQSGAEIILDLLNKPTDQRPRRITWISRRPNFLPLDDSPFTNDFFMPGYSDYFANLPSGTRNSFNAEHRLTSDGITESTLREIYQAIYQLRFIDPDRCDNRDLVALYPNRTVSAISLPEPNGTTVLTVVHNDQNVLEDLDVDTTIWATGYQSTALDFLEPIRSRLVRVGTEYAIDDNFSIQWDGPSDHCIFLQNAARQQRGLADPNLSLLAWRAQRIVDRLLGTDTAPQLDSFIDWSAKPPTDEVV